MIQVTQGYWRKEQNSSLVIECINRPSNSVGHTVGNHVCLEGYIGPLCEECDIFGSQWGIGYSKVGQYQCGRCIDFSSYVWKAMLVAVWTLLSILLAVRGDLQEQTQAAIQAAWSKQLSLRLRNVSQSSPHSKQMNQSQLLSTKLTSRDKEQSNKKSFSNQEKGGVYIKMFMNYLQIMGCIITLNPSLTTNLLLEVSQFFQNPFSSQMNYLDCTLKQIQTDIPIIYLRLLFNLLVPIAYLLTFILGLIIQRLFTKTKIRLYSICTASIFIFILMQPGLISQMIAALSRRQIGDTQYILINLNYVCRTPQHQKYSAVLAGPALILIAFFIPLGLFFTVYANRENLQTISVMKKYGYLYREYKNRNFYWEFVKMFEKSMIIIILSFYVSEVDVKGLLIFVIIALYGIASNMLQPYNQNGYNLIDFYLTLVCGITALLFVFISNNPFDYFVIISILIIYVINAWFVVFVIQRALRRYSVQFKELLIKVGSKFACAHKFIDKFCNNKKRSLKLELKLKIRRNLLEFVKLTNEKKQELILSGLKKQIERNHSRLFKSQSIGGTTDDQNLLVQSNSKNQQQLLASQFRKYQLDDQGSPESIFTDQIEACRSPALCQVEPFDLETNYKQEDQRQQKLDQYQSNPSNNKIQHEIIFSEENNTNEATHN